MLQPHPGQARSDNPERPSGMIQVTVRTTGGFKIHQSGLDYEGLKRFIAKLEGLC